MARRSLSRLAFIAWVRALLRDPLFVPVFGCRGTYLFASATIGGKYLPQRDPEQIEKGLRS